MKRLILITLCLILASTGAFAYTVDGIINDWSFNLSSAYAGNDAAWTPWSPTADFVIENNIHPDHNPECDWTGYCAYGYHSQAEPKVQAINGKWYVEPVGGEVMDVEALMFDDDSHNGYFLIVTSMPESGFTDAWGRHIDPGDLAIDLDNDLTTGQHGYEYGVKLTGPNKGQICYMPTWTLPNINQGVPENTPSTMACDGADSIVTGSAQVVWANTGVPDHGFDNFYIEIGVPKATIGFPSSKTLSKLHTTLTCGNDVIEINEYEWDYDVPEFSVIAAAIVLVASGLYIKRKRN